VQQLTKVIYHLNAKGEDAADTSDTANNYENEIEGILRDAGERVKRFQAACSHQTDMKLIEQKVREVEMKYEGQKQRALRDFEEYKRRSSAAQAAIKQEAEARVAVMAKDLEAQRREFAQRIKEFAEVTDGLEKKVKDSEKGQKKRAASELAEIVQKHNGKFNEMLQQRMAEEEKLKQRLEKEHAAKLAEATGSLVPELEAARKAQAELQRQLDETRAALEAARQGEADARRTASDAEREMKLAEAEAVSNRSEAERSRADAAAERQAAEPGPQG